MERPPSIAWPVPDGLPALSPHDVHLWCAWLDDPAAVEPAAAALLSPEESTRAAAFHFDADRRRFVAAHCMVRRLLGGYLGASPETLHIVRGEFGKPALVGPPGLHFNLSHSGSLAVLAVARDQSVGVDIEQSAEIQDLPLLEERMFGPEDCQRQQRLGPEARRRSFFRRWTQLEAIGKCRGTGLDLDAPANGKEHLIPADPADGFTGFLACEQAPERVAFLRYIPKVLLSSQTTASPRTILPGSPHRRIGLSPLSSS